MAISTWTGCTTLRTAAWSCRCMLAGGDVAEAEDAVQDAFVAALRKQRELRRVANPEAWVRTAALNRLRNTWRHASVVRLYQRKVPGPQAPVSPVPSMS